MISEYKYYSVDTSYLLLLSLSMIMYTLSIFNQCYCYIITYYLLV